MSNMSYCRFENTMRAVQDCGYVLGETDLTELLDNLDQYEKSCAISLIKLCIQIAELQDELTEYEDQKHSNR